MRKIIVLFSLFLTAAVHAQSVEYSLPKTELHFRVLVEKSAFEPGEFAIYSERYLKKNAPTEASVQYRLLDVNMYATAQADAEKKFSIPVDRKHTVFNMELDQNGVLMAINAKPQSVTVPEEFVAQPKAAKLNPHDFMNQDILSAGSTAKMAELTAREIYDIRDSRNQLSRGEADFMPKDGEQLKLMFQNLSQQEGILLQTFQGCTEVDTLEYDIRFVPENNSESVLFRLSKYIGVVDNDDLSGEPYNVKVENLQQKQEVEIPFTGKKKEEIGVNVNLPSKAKITVVGPDGKNVKAFETYVAQFGELEMLPMSLFGKKMLTKVVLDSVNGSVIKLDAEPIE